MSLWFLRMKNMERNPDVIKDIPDRITGTLSTSGNMMKIRSPVTIEHKPVIAGIYQNFIVVFMLILNEFDMKFYHL
ncbi:hypothetical protein [Elizabethkingia meningoseptica]|uniref:hypothetical protein n=1 Tax=Elizabethkingia meningoseptica TaxID=238 RepID=UPI0023AE9085|nr:hypothetical protein [Elizabethkingia meningoseptica]MDE5491386.1 hypothetical protein [Elizabethkingia meningoseptica]